MPLPPQQALCDAGEPAPRWLPVVDHYCGVERLMRKSLALQQSLQGRFDVTLDCEDGAPVGGEAEHVALLLELLAQPQSGRVGARVHPIDHPAFEMEVSQLVAGAGPRLAYLMLPKVEGAEQLARGAQMVGQAWQAAGHAGSLPLHALVETHGALREVDALAAHPAIESLSFGLMDFVSAHRGAIPGSAMSLDGQFQHPLVLRAKLAIGAACHAFGKTPSHCVVTEFKNAERLREAARRAAHELGYTRMWSIHPDQIEPILDALTPPAHEIAEAVDILTAAQAADWAPTRHRDRLHDRASYRYYWHLLARAHDAKLSLPPEAVAFFQQPQGLKP
ncbi:MAG: HpcH/HpaI aldolase/citrate lyase family protein [Inhella sp.]|jgi:citrate lyase subunit beta/citryl-CoA lyase|uniref:HpcH/HpaI aldolase/citrate lyase family protein n=1 Tax=Inhella sp. TaxID=1921806 RepID=UPI0022C5862B|nr:aldolase/citrate lyase family protein [Inhella sp.]MCZ8236336.1 aldolase/citrate lyase family protein [Inhella sp.]